MDRRGRRLGGSWFLDCPIGVAEIAPGEVEGRVVADRELCGKRLVEIDPESGLVVDVEVSVLEFGAAGEAVDFGLAESVSFLDTKVWGGQVEMNIGGVSDGRDVTGSVPRRADTEELAHRRHLFRRTEATDLRNVHANEVDQSSGDEWSPFVGVIEQFAHRDRDGGLLSEVVEVADIFGSEGVFDEEGSKLFEVTAELNGEHWRDSFVDVVQQFDLVAELFADEGEQLRDESGVGFVRPGFGPAIGGHRVVVGGGR